MTHTPTRFSAILSDMDGVFRTVPLDYIEDCVRTVLEKQGLDTQALSRQHIIDFSSSDLFVNDSAGLLEFCYYILTDERKPAASLFANVSNTPVIYHYVAARRAEAGPWKDLEAAHLQYQKLVHGVQGQARMKPILEALEGLQALQAAGAPLCIVSNAPRASVSKWFAAQGVTPSHVLGSDDVQFQKPHPEGLLTACEALGVLPGRKIAYCGDLPNDIVAARACSITAVGIAYADRLDRLWQARPDLVFADFGKFARYALGEKESPMTRPAKA